MSYKPRVLEVGAGGTGASTLTAHGVLLGQATSAITALAVGATGTVLAGVTGADPAFTATPALTSITFGSGTALNAFNETTFTPSLALSTPGSSSFTYTSQVGRYTQIGAAIFFTIRVELTSFTIGSGSGNVTIQGLPIAAGNVSNQIFTCPIIFQNVTTGVLVSWYNGLINPAATSIVIAGNRTATTNLNLDSAGIPAGSGTVISCSGWYATT